ncbi:mobilization protein, partial [Campylobacter coli]
KKKEKEIQDKAKELKSKENELQAKIEQHEKHIQNLELGHERAFENSFEQTKTKRNDRGFGFSR